MFRIKRWQLETRIVSEIIANGRLAGNEGAPLRRTFVRPRDDMTDDSCLPSKSRNNQQFVLLGLIAADFAKWDIQAIGADACSFLKNRLQIALPERKASKARYGSLLTQKLPDFSCVTHVVCPVFSDL